MSDGESLTLTPPEIKQLAEGAAKDLLPEKSKIRYQSQYNIFKKWCELKNVKTYSESVMLAYFAHLIDKGTNSLWAIYSMLRACISINNNIDISKYAKLISYLKKKSSLHKPKKSEILDEEQISAFISKAPDESFLLMKVILIVGVSGACRREELYNMTTNDLQIKDDIILIEIPKTKTNVSRSFVITKPEWVNIIKQYLQIRVKINEIKDRLFLRYERRKCCKSVVGINSIGSVPTKIAEFLHLENPKLYTGHCFRRSSATLLVNRGGDLLSLKRHGGWKSSNVAEGYVQESLKRKIQVAEMMTEPSTSKRPNLSMSSVQADLQTLNNEINQPSTSNQPNLPSVQVDFNNPFGTNIQSNQMIPGLFSGLEHCTITVNIYNNCTVEKECRNKSGCKK